MRDTFVHALLQYAHTDRNVILVTGDLGFGVLDAFRREVPAQFINAGVAEQAMTGLATGLALAGKNVFTYSIANFPTLRCLEQIRNDVIYHGARVNVVSVGGGLSYGALGMSHHATEDVAIMRALPGIRIFTPCDATETRAVLGQMIAQPQPTYVRIDKSMVTTCDEEPFEPGRLRHLRPGTDVAIVAYGGIVGEALDAARQLSLDGISCSIHSAHTLRPFDADTLIHLAQTTHAVVTVEEHSRVGGLGSLAADVFMDSGIMPPRFAAICLPEAYSSVVGSQQYLRTRYGIDASAIVARIKKAMNGSSRSPV